jgi:predicted RNA binding protein YcfA (HicA-like mRNA interferase family)
MKYRDLIKLLEEDGWLHVRTSGSHRVYRHAKKEGIVVVPVHSTGHDVPKGLLSAIMKQAGINQ